MLAACATAGRAQTVPTATASASQQLIGSFTNPVIGHMGTNQNGDVFYVNSAYSGSAVLYQLPRGSRTPVQIATGFSGARNVYVDSVGNLYVPNAYGGNILEVPLTSTGYATNITIGGSTPSCNSYTPTAPCYQFGSVGAVGGYYYQPLDLGLDSKGNAYIVNAYANGSCAGNCILKFTKNNDTAGGYTPSVLKSNITAQNYNAQIAVDPAGDVFYEAGGTVLYTIAAGSANPVSFGTSITSVAGVSVDPYGNLYVTNSSTPYAIYEFPAVNGVVSTTSQYALIGTYSGNGPAVDALGDLYYNGYSGGPTLAVANVNSIPLGSATVGTSVAAAATSVTFTFSGSTTVGSISSTGAGFTYAAGSCAAGSTYAAGGTCTVNVNYTPTAAGLQRGAVVLNNAAGVPIAAALLSGSGNGALETNDPATVTSVGSGYTSPRGVALDVNGNLYVADAGQNAVLRYAGGAGTATTVGTGLKAPSAVATDNAGNVYIVDTGNSRVVEVPLVNGVPSNAAQTVIYSSSSANLNGAAVDFAGNLYVSDGSAKSLTELLNVGGTPRRANAIALGTLTAPAAVAADPNGNVLVADGNSVVRIAYVGKATSTVSSAFNKPTALAVDASSSLYIADNGNARLLKVPFENGAYNTNDQYQVGATVATPYGVAVDTLGNLYVSDAAAATVSFLNRNAGTLNFDRVQLPSSSATLNATIGNAGTTALTFGTPQYVAVSATPTYFKVAPGATKGCANGSTLATGFACTLGASFTPATAGPATEALTFNSNALNTTKTLTLTGRGVNLFADTLTLTASPTTVAFGSSITVTAAVTSTMAGTATGTVSFTVDGNSQGRPVALSSSAMASVVLNNLTGGTHQVCGVYTGDDNFQPNNSCINVVVTRLATNTTLGIAATGANPVTSSVTQAVTLTATINSTATTPPTGTVTFTTGQQVLGTTQVSAAPGGGYTAVLSTTALPAGTDTIVATYNGDVNYATSSGSAVDIVTYPTVIISPSSSTISLGKVDSASVTIQVTSLGGFAGNVALSCSGLPANTVCSFSPNSFSVGVDQPQTVTLQVRTGQTPVVAQPITGMLLIRSVGTFACFVLMPLGFAARRRVTGNIARHLLSVVLFLAAGYGALALTGCGNGFVGDTPTGNSNVTITANATTPTTANTSYAYSAYAPGCVASPQGNLTLATCTVTAGLSLTVR